MSSRLRLLLACLATAVIVVPLGWFWWSSLMPDEYSVTDMGYADLGGGPVVPAAGREGHAGMHQGGAIDTSTLVESAEGDPDVTPRPDRPRGDASRSAPAARSAATR